MLRLLAWIFGVLPFAVVAVLGVAVVGLNTVWGRGLAVREINHFAGPQISVAGLAGHFPEDIKLASVSVSDSGGVWLTGQTIQLRWKPWALMRHRLDVVALTAAAVDVIRQPLPGKARQGGGFSLPKLSLTLGRLAVPDLAVGPALAGEPVVLNVSGAAAFADAGHGEIVLNAATPDGSSTYQLKAGIEPENVALVLHVAEPPDGLLGHFAGPQVHGPLSLGATLAGPRGCAALNFDLALGTARLHGAGTLDLLPSHPSADMVLSIPALAPFAAMANQPVAGATQLHMIVQVQPNGQANLSLNGTVGLTVAPYGLAKSIGSTGQVSLQAELNGKTVNIEQLDISGAAFSIAAAGSVAAQNIDLNTQITINQVAAFSPSIAGNLAESGTIIGSPKDFAVNALLTGDITEHHIPSGRFSLSINAQHLPLTPNGTLTGSGALENFPLLLDAEFSRAAGGAATLQINNALWRSLNAQADLALATGTVLPTGTAKFTVGNLSDFAAFSPVPLHGSMTGDFAHLGGERFKLDLTAQNLLTLPQLGAINGSLSAVGPTNALAVKLRAWIAKFFGLPARLALAGALNLDARSANLSAFSANWHQINAVLLGPAGITTQPGIAVEHLALGLDGGRIALNGTLTPSLNAQMSVNDVAARLVSLFDPAIQATGMLSATANLTGSASAPNGQLSLSATDIRLHTGPAAALPPADFAATASIAGTTANINAKLTAGPNVALAADGLLPERKTGALDLHVMGRTDLRLLAPILAAQGSVARGLAALDVTLSGSPAAPRANGSATLANGSVEDIGSGLNLTQITATLAAAGQSITLQRFEATAGKGSITAHGTANLGGAGIPLEFKLGAHNATPISSDIVTETLDGALTLTGTLRGQMALGGRINIDRANINIPKSLPPDVANLPIIDAGQTPPPTTPPPPPVALDLTVRSGGKIFIRGDGLFAELGGQLHITGTAANPDPEGGFDLIRGNISLAGKTLQFRQGRVSFNGDGFEPALDLEASTVTTDNNTTATLIVGGTAAQPTITLSSSPPLPSDEILAQLLFGESTANLTPFQAASLAAALAQLSGVGGSVNPLDSVRNALGLDELSLGGSGSGPPSLLAGRYVAPGVYVGATQSTTGQGTQASVQVNLYKGLKLETTTGAGAAGSGDTSSVGLTYQFNY